MARSGRIQGTAKVRPWRLGVLVDANSQAEIKRTVEALSGIWGGYYCPLFDRATPENELVRSSAIYDIDSLYDSSDRNPAAGLTQRAGYEWPSGFFDPLTSIDGSEKHRGLLPTEDLLLTADSGDYVFPIWSEDDAAAMVHAINWGRSGDRESVLPRCVSVAELSLLPARMDDLDHVGPVQASRFGMTLARREAEAYRGIWVVDPDDCSSLLSYWNLRASGANVFAISPSIDDVAWSFLTVALRSFCSEVISGSTPATILYLYNADIVSLATKARLDDWAAERDIRLVDIPAALEDLPGWRTLPATTTVFSMGFSTNFQANDHGLDIPIPHIPWTNSSRAKLNIGCVAVEVSIGTESNQEVNRTGRVPPYRQVSRLMRSRTGRGTICDARVGPSGTAFLVQANEECLWYPFPHSLEVIASLFVGSDSALESIDQSDLGKLQSRTSAILGGHSSTAAQEPGIRSVLKHAAARPSGVTPKQIRDLIFRDRADWPGPQVVTRLADDDYSDDRADLLLRTGLLVPFMDVSCNACGVTSQLHPKELDAQIKCQYCGDVFQLASSPSLDKTKLEIKASGTSASAQGRVGDTSFSYPNNVISTHNWRRWKSLSLFGSRIKICGDQCSRNGYPRFHYRLWCAGDRR